MVMASSKVTCGRALLLDDHLLRPPMGDHHGGVGEDLAAGDMVAVVVAVDEVADRPVPALGDLGLQPLRRLGVDRVRDDHAVRRHREDREVEVVAEAVDLAGDAGDLAHRRRRLRLLLALHHGPGVVVVVAVVGDRVGRHRQDQRHGERDKDAHLDPPR
jgi:hypothetical protein